MVKIEDFDQGLRYVVGLGFTVKPGLPGYIPAAQGRMCDAEGALYNAAGKKYPYQAHYHRADRKFTVISADGAKATVRADWGPGRRWGKGR